MDDDSKLESLIDDVRHEVNQTQYKVDDISGTVDEIKESHGKALEEIKIMLKAIQEKIDDIKWSVDCLETKSISSGTNPQP